MRPSRPSGSLFITRKEYDAVAEHVWQERAHRQDPAGNPAPNPEVLKVWPSGSAIERVTIEPAPWDGQPLAAIKFHHSVAEEPRKVPLLFWAGILLCVGAGMTTYLHPNKTGGGFLYPVVKPFSGSAPYPFGRLLKDAAFGQRVTHYKSDGKRTDHRYITHRTVRLEGTPRSAVRVRDNFYLEAARHFEEHRREAGFEATTEQHIETLKLAFWLADEEG